MKCTIENRHHGGGQCMKHNGEKHRMLNKTLVCEKEKSSVDATGAVCKHRGYFQRAREGSGRSVCKVREMLAAAARWIVRPRRSGVRCAG